jgi:hypothetical protein
MKKLVYVPMVVLACAAVAFVVSCSKTIGTAESDSFKVSVRFSQLFDYNVHVEVGRKSSNGDFRRVVSVERDRSVDVKLLDDSILVVSGIRARSDGYPSLLANLQDDNLPELYFQGGVPMVARDTTRLSTIQLGDTVAATFRKNSRSDVYFITAGYLPRPYGFGTVVITLLGASGVEIVDWSGDFLVFDCIWLRQPSRQRFSVNLADRSLKPEDFSIIESVSSP